MSFHSSRKAAIESAPTRPDAGEANGKKGASGSPYEERLRLLIVFPWSDADFVMAKLLNNIFSRSQM